jgi:exonuclease III
MLIISLNIWGGRMGSKILDFFKKYRHTDIFLLQEVFHQATDITAWHEEDRKEMFNEISNILPEHDGFFAPVESDEWGLAIFVKKSINIEKTGDIFVHRYKNAMIGNDGSTLGRNLQYISMSKNNTQYTVINFHGLWNGKGKTDTEDRLSQSKKIVDFVKQINQKIIIGGDFNLRPNTESIKMLEENLNLKNLISEYSISSTRTSLYSKEDKFADYMLTSSDLKIEEFKVLEDEVSDHSPLYLKF